MSNIGERIKQLRLEKGWTQEVLAKLLGVSRLAVARWETGERRPRRKYIDRLAELFEVSVEELLGVEAKEEKKGFKIFKASELEFKVDPLALKLVQELLHSKGIPFRETPIVRKLLLMAEGKIKALRTELEVFLDIIQQLPEDTIESPPTKRDN